MLSIHEGLGIRVPLTALGAENRSSSSSTKDAVALRAPAKKELEPSAASTKPKSVAGPFNI